MSDYQDRLDGLHRVASAIHAAACALCLGNGTLASRIAWPGPNGSTVSQQTTRQCPRCDGSGFERAPEIA